jgi:hypothetical protein
MASDLKSRASQVGSGIFLIGLALLFILKIDIWPYIMFVIAISLLANEYTETNTIDFKSSRVVSAAVVAIIGLFFVADVDWGNIWPIFLIIAGLGLLFGNRLRGDKRKNEE